jgi:uncharacterized membrane protein
MAKIRVLLAGESWVSAGTHTKGFDHFFAADYQVGIGPLRDALNGSVIELIHLPGHLAPTDFPSHKEALAEFDVVVLSDIGSNSLLLHPDTFLRGERTPNRLSLIAEWVEEGGGFMMVGGYLSFQGMNGAARYHRTAIERILPIEMLPHDDRVEVPKVSPRLREMAQHIRCLPGSAASGRICSAITRRKQSLARPRFSWQA